MESGDLVWYYFGRPEQRMAKRKAPGKIVRITKNQRQAMVELYPEPGKCVRRILALSNLERRTDDRQGP